MAKTFRTMDQHFEGQIMTRLHSLLELVPPLHIAVCVGLLRFLDCGEPNRPYPETPKRESGVNIVLMRLDGSGMTMVTPRENTRCDWHPCIHPNGKLVFYEHERTIRSRNIQTGEDNLIIQDGMQPQLSPEGSRILYAGVLRPGFYVYDISTGRTFGSFGGEHLQGSIRFSSDGSMLIYGHGCASPPDSLHLDYQPDPPLITLVNYDGTSSTDLTSSLPYYVDPQLTPDGLDIIVVSHADSGQHLFRLSTIDLTPVNLTRGLHTSVLSPLLSPNGQCVLYYGWSSTIERWCLIDCDGTNLRMISQPLGMITSNSFRFSHDGNVIVCSAWSELAPYNQPNPGWIYVFRSSDGATVHRIESNGNATPGSSFGYAGLTQDGTAIIAECWWTRAI